MLTNQKINGPRDTLEHVLRTLRDFPSYRLDPIYRGIIEDHIRAAAFEINEVIMYVELEGKSEEPRKRVCL